PPAAPAGPVGDQWGNHLRRHRDESLVRDLNTCHPSSFTHPPLGRGGRTLKPDAAAVPGRRVRTPITGLEQVMVRADSQLRGQFARRIVAPGPDPERAGPPFMEVPVREFSAPAAFTVADDESSVDVVFEFE